MVHINELNSHIHYQILYFASGGPAEDIDEWKRKLTLLQVCTKWYGLLKSYVFSRGFINIHSLKRNENPYINMKSCVYYADTDIVCRSNLGIITGRDKHDCGCVSELKVGVDRILDIGMYGHILKKLSTLGVGYWLNISSLKFDSTLRPYGSHMLRFPRLQSLTLHNPPVDCDVLFTDTMPTQLNELGIYGNANSIAAASRLRFSKIDDLTVVVYGDEALSDEFYFAADSYFGYTNIELTTFI
ncbi:hypothetical protein LPJ72_003808 [Coemansia sp. Benny D160-2]|nr:hypothetical protein LPJ72_003808 [Coemansia sp. Benny D160-2]